MTIKKNIEIIIQSLHNGKTVQSAIRHVEKWVLKKEISARLTIKSRCQKVEVIKSPIFGLLVGGQTEEKRQSRNFISGREVRN